MQTPKRTTDMRLFTLGHDMLLGYFFRLLLNEQLSYTIQHGHSYHEVVLRLKCVRHTYRTHILYTLKNLSCVRVSCPFQCCCVLQHRFYTSMYNNQPPKDEKFYRWPQSTLKVAPSHSRQCGIQLYVALSFKNFYELILVCPTKSHLIQQVQLGCNQA